MTFKELLDSVNYDEVERQIRNMYPYPETGNLGWYRMHFDMLRHLTPKHDDDANDDVCHITMEEWDDGSGPHLDAYPMEGDLWEHSLTKEIVIAPDVKATNEEIAACCLWHTSFHGFTTKQVIVRYRCHDGLAFTKQGKCVLLRRSEIIAKKNYKIICKNGGTIPNIRALSSSKKKELIALAKESIYYGDKRMNKTKRKREFRKEFMELYYERMVYISDFIIEAIPAIKDKANDNYLDTEQLSYLFESDNFYSEEFTSYADESISGAKYLHDLILKYKMLPHFDRMIYILTTSEPIETMTEDDLALQNVLMDNCKSGDIIFATDPSLGRQIRINYATFNTRYPLVR